MDKYEEKLDKYKKKYLKRDTSDFWKAVRDIVSDIQYFKEHIGRTKKSESFSYEIRLGREGSIHHFFFRQIESYIIQDYLREEDKLLKLLEVYHLLTGMFDRVTKWEDERKNIHIKELIDFSEVVEWYVGLKLDDYLGAFIGCGSMIESVKKHIQKLKPKETK